MKKGPMIAAGVLAFGIGAARAQTTSAGTGSGADTAVTPAMPGDPTVPTADPTQPPPLTTAPNASTSDVPAPAGNDSVVEPAPVAPLPAAPEPLPTTPVYSDASPYAARPWTYPVGVALLVGGGFQDFSNGTLRSMTGNGGYWNARAAVGTRQFVGLEAAYVGDARAISGLGLSGNSTLTSNGVEGAVRLNLPIPQGRSLVEPFAFVGLGWAHYHVSDNNAATSDVATSDDVMTLPYGGGLELAYRGFMADARFTYRQTYYNNLLGANGGNLNNWGVGGQIGFEY